jgi:hypothetical protein
MLKYWIDPLTTHDGIHVHDIASQKTYVSTGKGKTPFSFAIGRDLYVVTSGGIRAVALEKWFSTLEGSLASLARQAHERTEPIMLKPRDLTRALKAAVGMECRSPYIIRKFQKALEDNPELRALISPEVGRPISQQVLENIIHQVDERLASMAPIELTFLHAPASCSWLVCDCPYFNHESLGHRFVVLTNKVMLVYAHGEEPGQYQYVTASDDFASFLNTQLALQARDWIAADSRALLDQYIPIIGSDDWSKRVAEETVNLHAVQHLSSSWTIVR